MSKNKRNGMVGKLHRYIIPVEWKMRGSVEVYAYDKEDAENKIKMEVVGEPVSGVYVVGSAKVIKEKKKELTPPVKLIRSSREYEYDY